MITLKERAVDEKAATQQTTHFECELWNETKNSIRVYICNAQWLHVYVVNPGQTMRDVWIREGHNALSAFSLADETCIQADSFDLHGSVCILIGP